MKFYFDIKDDFFAAVDEDGVDLPGPEAAEKEAIAMATSIARDVASAKGRRSSLQSGTRSTRCSS